jgi:hypothetical protein
MKVLLNFSIAIHLAFTLSVAHAYLTSITTQRTGRSSTPFISTSFTTHLFGLTDRVASKTEYGSFTTEEEVRSLFKVRCGHFG